MRVRVTGNMTRTHAAYVFKYLANYKMQYSTSEKRVISNYVGMHSMYVGLSFRG